MPNPFSKIIPDADIYLDTNILDDKPNHFCGTSQGKHNEDSIEKDCEASQTDLFRRPVELGLKAKAK